jgi:hypothetical protein
MRTPDSTVFRRLGNNAASFFLIIFSVLAFGISALGQTAPSADAMVDADGANSLSAAAVTAPILTLTSNFSLIDFGRLNTGLLSANRVLTISNSGSATLFITSVTITGINSADYTLVSTTCNNASLSTTGTCTATVRFNPLAVGVRTANLTVANNANGSQHLVPFRGTGLNPNIPNKAVGPIDPRIGFPLWYRDELGVRLTTCLDNSGYCVLPEDGFNPLSPMSVTTANVNFPGEAFYWSAEAEINRSIGGQVRLVIAKENAFTTENATVGNQINFERIRVRIDALTPGATYVVTHPFGTLSLVADDEGEIDTTEDLGCGTSPCDFRASLDGKISRFLKWNPAVAPAAPAGYLGNPNVLHTITGSPLNTNLFKVTGPNVGGPGINTIQTTLFALAGKLFQ